MHFEERRDFPVGSWDECPGVFMLEKVLDTCFRVLPAPTKDMMMSIASLSAFSIYNLELVTSFFTVYGFTSYNLLWAQEEATTFFARHISKKKN